MGPVLLKMCCKKFEEILQVLYKGLFRAGIYELYYILSIDSFHGTAHMHAGLNGKLYGIMAV